MKMKTEDPEKADMPTSGLKDIVGSDPLIIKFSDENSAVLIKELTEGVFIHNAGAVIIASFLPALFSRTGILTDNTIRDLNQALSLVHYCITGSKSPVEFDLLLPKILLGIEPETVFDPDIFPDEKQISEADEMLASIVEYWDVLKDTTIDGLREAFLQRKGKLTFNNEEWFLIVEQKPYDMLLEQLPWNISMIKLPWMRNLLRTQWIINT
jgi:hypothetical protein